ncbi:MAG: NAD(P)-dependent oxidoreductase [Chitinophagales bacterium]
MYKKEMKILVGYLPEEYPGVEVFNSLGQTMFKKYDRDWLNKNIQTFDIIITHLFETIDSELIDKAVRLKILATPSTGTDHIEKSLLSSRNIQLVTLNDDRDFIDTISSTAELAWLLILACARKLPALINRVLIDQKWVNTDIRGIELQGKSIGIIGYGRLGKKMAEYANAFKMNVLSYDSSEVAFENKLSFVKNVELDELLSNSDVITLHVKLNDTSKNLIGIKQIQQMKNGVILINTSRGGLIDSDAVLNGLNSGKISSIGVDALNNEYQSTKLPDDVLIKAAMEDSRIIITPHVGGSTFDSHAKVFAKLGELISKHI